MALRAIFIMYPQWFVSRNPQKERDCLKTVGVKTNQQKGAWTLYAVGNVLDSKLNICPSDSVLDYCFSILFLNYLDLHFLNKYTYLLSKS